MNSELDKQLVEKYPKIFKDRYGNMKTTAMCWGFECSNGWYWLIDNLCQYIQFDIDNNSKQEIIKNRFYRFLFNTVTYIRFTRITILQPLRKFLWKKTGDKIFRYLYSKEKIEIETIPQVVATQVKEKFGGLRFYYNGGNNEISGMVRLAEHLSYSICEDCGTTKNVSQNKGGWIYTLCDDCRTGKNLKK